MYQWSTSSPCYRSSCSSNSNTNGPPSQPDAAAFLSSLPLASASSYGDLLLQEQQCYYSQAQQPPMQVPFRRVVSTGDLLEAAPVAVGRYSAEERRERIEKYRAKRNQRNFQKKITYACRKTLADSRPRVKGRFARNDGAATDAAEPEFTTEVPNSLMNDEADVGASSSSSMPEWWPAMQQVDALAREDEELLAAYLAVSSINLY